MTFRQLRPLQMKRCDVRLAIGPMRGVAKSARRLAPRLTLSGAVLEALGGGDGVARVQVRLGVDEHAGKLRISAGSRDDAFPLVRMGGQLLVGANLKAVEAALAGDS